MTDAMFSNIQKMEVLTLGGGSTLEGAHSVTMGLNASLSGIRNILGSYLRDSIYPNDGSTIASSLGDTFTQTSANNVGLNITGNVGADYFSIGNATLLGKDTINGVANQGDRTTLQGGTTLLSAAAMDTLEVTSSTQTLLDTCFGNISLNGNGALFLSDSLNTATIELDTKAAAAGIKNIFGSSIYVLNANKTEYVLSPGSIGLIANIGANDTVTSTFVGGASCDSISINTRLQFSANTFNLGGGTADTLTVVNGGGTYGDTDFSKISGVEILSLGGSSAVTASLGATAMGAGITAVYGGSGFNSLFQTSAFTKALTLKGGNVGNSFAIASSTLVGNDTIIGGSGIDSLTLLTDSQQLTDAIFAKNLTSIEVVKTANGNNFILAGTNAQAEGLVALVGGTLNDTFNASAYSTGITITGGGGVDSLLSGGGNDLYNFATSTDLGSVAIVNGAAGTDIVAMTTDAQTIGDSLFGKYTNVELFKTANGSNNITFGNQAQDAGFTSFVGGSGADFFLATLMSANLDITGNGGADNLLAGSGNDLFNFGSLGDMTLSATVSGGTGSDTVSLSGDGANSATIGDTAFAKLASIEVFATGNGSNLVTLSSTAVDAGINTVVGGSGRDTFIVNSSFLNIPATYINGAGGTDVLALSNNDQTISDSFFAKLKSIEVIQTANGANSLTLGSAAITEGATTFLGGSNNDNFYVSSTFLSLPNVSLNGGAGTNTMALTTDGMTIADSTFRQISSVQGLQTGNGSNTIYLNTNAAATGIATVTAGSGNDVFIVSSAFFSNTSTATLRGGAGIDSLTISDTLAAQTIGDAAFSKLSGIEYFQTASLSSNVTFGTNAQSAGITTIIGSVSADTLNASANSNNLVITGNGGADSLLSGSGSDLFNFSGTTDVALAATIAGGSGTDTLALTTDAQILNDTLFAKLSSIDVLKTANGANSITLSTTAMAKGLSNIVGGTGADTISASTDTLNLVITGNGGADVITTGSGNDQIIFSTASDLNVASLTLNGGSDTLSFTASSQTLSDTSFQKTSFDVLQLASGSNSVTMASLASASGVTKVIGGTGNDSFNVSSTLFGGTLSINGGSGYDTLALSTDSQTIGDSAFNKFSSIEVFKTGNGTNSVVIGSTLQGVGAQAAGISQVIGGTGDDKIDASALMTSTMTLDGGGKAVTVDTLTGGSGSDLFVLASSSGSYYATFKSPPTLLSAGANNYAKITSLDSTSLLLGVDSGDRLQLNQQDYLDNKYQLGATTSGTRTTNHVGLYDNGYYVADISLNGFTVATDGKQDNDFFDPLNNHVKFV